MTEPMDMKKPNVAAVGWNDRGGERASASAWVRMEGGDRGTRQERDGIEIEERIRKNKGTSVQFLTLHLPSNLFHSVSHKEFLLFPAR